MAKDNSTARFITALALGLACSSSLMLVDILDTKDYAAGLLGVSTTLAAFCFEYLTRRD